VLASPSLDEHDVNSENEMQSKTAGFFNKSVSGETSSYPEPTDEMMMSIQSQNGEATLKGITFKLDSDFKAG